MIEQSFDRLAYNISEYRAPGQLIPRARQKRFGTRADQSGVRFVFGPNHNSKAAGRNLIRGLFVAKLPGEEHLDKLQWRATWSI